MRSYNIGKKAQSDETLIHLPIMFYIIFVVIVIAVMLNVFINRSVNIENAELKIISNRLIHESSVYDKETGRTYEGQIDSKELTEGKIDKAINYGGDNRLSAKISYDGWATSYNEKWYTRIRPRVGYDAKRTISEVFVTDVSNNLKGAEETIEAVT